MSKPIENTRYGNPAAQGTASVFATVIGPIHVAGYKHWRPYVTNTASVTFNVQIQAAPVESSTENLSLWVSIPTTTLDFACNVASGVVEAPNCAVENNTFNYIRVQAYHTSTGISAPADSIKLFLSGERK